MFALQYPLQRAALIRTTLHPEWYSIPLPRHVLVLNVSVYNYCTIRSYWNPVRGRLWGSWCLWYTHPLCYKYIYVFYVTWLVTSGCLSSSVLAPIKHLIPCEWLYTGFGVPWIGYDGKITQHTPSTMPLILRTHIYVLILKSLRSQIHHYYTFISVY